MKKILICGRGDSIFLVNYVKALKKCMDVEVHLYYPYPDNGVYSEMPYDKVIFDNYCKSKFNKIRKVSAVYQPIILYYNFLKYLKENKAEKYDVIHIHRVLPVWVTRCQDYKKYCKKLYVSFWGLEIDKEKYAGSHTLYLYLLGKLMNTADLIIGSMTDKRITDKYPIIKEKSHFALFGSSIIDILCHDNITRTDAKKTFGIPQNKVSILLGYSGKPLHNHVEILRNIINHPDFEIFKERIHILASLTRDVPKGYDTVLENLIAESGCTSTVIKNCYQTDKEVAYFRKATDIFFQLSDSDYLSASVKENLCAGAVMISGDWLPYKILKDDGFYFEEVDSIVSGVELFFNVLKKYQIYSEKSESNLSLCNKKYSWDACIKDWADCYNMI